MELGKCVLTHDKRSCVVELFADRMYKTYFLHTHEIVVSLGDLYYFLKMRNHKNICVFLEPVLTFTRKSSEQSLKNNLKINEQC